MAILVSDASRLSEIKCELEKLNFYDKSRRVARQTEGEYTSFAVPITETCKTHLSTLAKNNQPLPHPFEKCWLQDVVLPPSKSALAISHSPHSSLVAAVDQFIKHSKLGRDCSDMLSSIPKSWEQHGDLIVLPASSFSSDNWTSFLDFLSAPKLAEFWSTVSAALNCKRLAIGNKISNNRFRSPGSKLVLGQDGWVEHVDNEKLRVAKLECEGEIVVDLFAGIGYFVLPYLVHGRARHVHACDWNPHAVEALEKGLRVNRVEDRCTIHYGDSKQFCLTNIADRVNLGLIPSSEDCWPVACASLKSTSGGWLHIHGNVNTMPDHEDTDGAPEPDLVDYQHLLQPPLTGSRSVVKWVDHVTERISHLLVEVNPLTPAGRQWEVAVRSVHHVKEYAPHIRHLVLDVHCKPLALT